MYEQPSPARFISTVAKNEPSGFDLSGPPDNEDRLLEMFPSTSRETKHSLGNPVLVMYLSESILNFVWETNFLSGIIYSC